MRDKVNKVKFVFHLLKFSVDPTNTTEVFRITDSLRDAMSPDQAARLGALLLKDPIFKAMYEGGNQDLLVKPYDVKALAALPPNTLGHRYGKLMASGGYDPEFFEYLSVKDPVSYFSVRIRKTHDIWHALTGFSTDVPGELGLQGFYLGQFASPGPLGIIASVLLHVIAQRDMALIRNAFDQLVFGYEAGKRAQQLFSLEWERHWEDDLEALRSKLGVTAFKSAA